MVVAQTKMVIRLFEIQHGEKVKGLFLFDNSTGHGAYREDALVSSRMNKKPGGKSSLMTGAWFIPDKNKPEERKDQCMQFQPGDVVLCEFNLKLEKEKEPIDQVKAPAKKKKDDQVKAPKAPSKHFDVGYVVKEGDFLVDVPKGMEQVLGERGLFPKDKNGTKGKLLGVCKKEKPKDARGICDEESEEEVLHKGTVEKQCCCEWLLSQCQDFKEQKSQIMEVVGEAGHYCIFLPKFHPELNFIERYWGHVKRNLRKECSYSMKDLEVQAPKELRDAVSLTVMRRYAQHAWRWMSAYRLGLFGESAAFAMKHYKSHRGVPAIHDRMIAKQIEDKFEKDKKDLEDMIASSL